MIYGLIFTAGKEQRFNSDKPKTLSHYNGTTVLDHNIHILSKYCDEVFVVCSNDNKSFFKQYNTIVIDSGYGCGDAVLKALLKTNFEFNDRCFIQWGDCIIDEEVLDGICNIDCTSRVIIPCSFEKNPYVALNQSDDRVKVSFSKYGEFVEEGYHDFGLFYCNPSYLFPNLVLLHSSIYINEQYVHRHGNEMQFLDVFNDTDTNGLIIAIENIVPKSFNTEYELKNIRQ